MPSTNPPRPPGIPAGAHLHTAHHHHVYTDGAYWYKAPAPGLPYAPAALAREARALALRGAPHTYVGGTLRTPHAGNPIGGDMDEAVVCALVAHLAAAPLAPAGHGLPTTAAIPATVAATTTARLPPGGPHAAGYAYCRALYPTTTGPAPTGGYLLHGDPNPGNWVRTPAGRYALVDWESARVGPVEVDLAQLWLGLVGEPGLGWRTGLPVLRAVRRQGYSVPTFWWAVWWRVPSTLAWAWRFRGYGEVVRRAAAFRAAGLPVPPPPEQ